MILWLWMLWQIRPRGGANRRRSGPGRPIGFRTSTLRRRAAGGSCTTCRVEGARKLPVNASSSIARSSGARIRKRFGAYRVGRVGDSQMPEPACVDGHFVVVRVEEPREKSGLAAPVACRARTGGLSLLRCCGIELYAVQLPAIVV